MSTLRKQQPVMQEKAGELNMLVAIAIITVFAILFFKNFLP